MDQFSTIYLIDDAKDTLFIHRYFLASLGYKNIFDYNDPVKAFNDLKVKSKNKPSILFLDLNMPTMTGWEFLEEIERKWPPKCFDNFKICILTSSCDPSDRERAREHPLVSLYAEKPFNSQDFKITIDLMRSICFQKATSNLGTSVRQNA